MDTAAVEPLVEITLSREELNLLTWLVGAETLPGLEADPVENLSREQQAMGIIHAEHSLRARDLARLDDSGHLVVNNVLLIMVEACAYPDQSLFVFHTLPGGTTYQHFGYRRAETMVIHSVREAALHHLSLMPDQRTFIEQIVSLCEARQLPETGAEPITVDRDILARARDIAARGDAQGAEALLQEKGAEAQSASIVANALATPHKVSFIVHATQLGDAIQRRELTVLHGVDTAWGMVPADSDETQTYTLSPMTTKDLKQTLRSWLQS